MAPPHILSAHVEKQVHRMVVPVATAVGAMAVVLILRARAELRATSRRRANQVVLLRLRNPDRSCSPSPTLFHGFCHPTTTC